MTQKQSKTHIGQPRYFAGIFFHDASHVDYGLLLEESSHTLTTFVICYQSYQYYHICNIYDICIANRYKQMTFMTYQERSK